MARDGPAVGMTRLYMRYSFESRLTQTVTAAFAPCAVAQYVLKSNVGVNEGEPMVALPMHEALARFPAHVETAREVDAV